MKIPISRLISFVRLIREVVWWWRCLVVFNPFFFFSEPFGKFMIVVKNGWRGCVVIVVGGFC